MQHRRIAIVPFIAGLVVAACASAGEETATSTTALTAADVPARRDTSYASGPLYVNPSAKVDRSASVEQWRGRHADSARILDAWALAHPSAASRLVAWSRREPEQFEVLVSWSITNPNDDIGAFLLTRQSWSELSALHDDEPEAVASLLHWARVSGVAAEELAVRYGGLAYVATHR